MVFSSMVFLFVFLPLVLGVYYGVLKNIKSRNIFLLAFSLVFYAWGEPVYILIMLSSIVINYFGGILIDLHRNKSKLILFIGIVCNLSFLFIFKYEGFVVVNLNSIFGLSLESLELPLPIGISFFTFQALSYLVDVYRKSAPVQKNILELGLYISFFPQLVAGPIVRYTTINEQIKQRTTTAEQFNEGVRRFIIGVGKKIVLANNFALIADAFFLAPSREISIIYAWVGAIAYSLQIYYDFSGYSDMAIGLGKMFGFEFLENFNYPYISKTVSEFWRRWHISLGSWFRDYVYFPLGGSRVNKQRMVFNLFVVWFLTGVWHGAAWQFILWGLMYFVLLTFEKLIDISRFLKNKFVSVIYQAFTMVCVIVGWVIFGSPDVKGAIGHIFAMFGGGYIFDAIGLDSIMEKFALAKNPLIDEGLANVNYLLLVIGIVLATPILTSCLNKMKLHTTKTFEFGSSLVYMSVLIVSISYLVIGAHNPFIYFNF
ncbi:hypothetical protein AN639_06860 [Candidatus Epulonipiscium fishelsonii]|uniref:Uncharacterized protein n=1 Tax=Candidatus Epulonipiscium fishelsonii TaxID=77094 RepID=A0ACC8XB36_9FIRM|nr:hypothetical protein AN639_06860 [Epulopiscium sp. SCG-B05WGA-EpuloA1]ONI39670.1 hypothetical protein AN396_07900 [Epulopiscium sp. SCG-B11WGA-EpuloA1]